MSGHRFRSGLRHYPKMDLQRQRESAGIVPELRHVFELARPLPAPHHKLRRTAAQKCFKPGGVPILAWLTVDRNGAVGIGRDWLRMSRFTPAHIRFTPAHIMEELAVRPGRTNRGGKRPQPAKPRIIDPRRTPWHPPNGRAHDPRIVAHASGSEPAMVRGLPGKKSPCSFIKSARQGGTSSGASFNNQCPPWPVQGAAASTTQRCQRTLSACISSAAWLVWTKTRSHCCGTSASGTAVEKSQIGTFGIPSRK